MVLFIIGIFVSYGAVFGDDVNDKGSLGGYHTYSELQDILQDYYVHYPDIVTIGNLTTLPSGEAINYIKLTIDSTIHIRRLHTQRSYSYHCCSQYTAATWSFSGFT